ncbi:hypothetical protein P167DRAFT_421568 [Morchella conica CCBAS932]|uniref:Uncharacterized protein n=1 Tax=Morchella conica CCBAS932 TaxID=1392247 RepID=A0A3N4KD29_9PEZI|nr:hypothetical protein P167DRAFT_421568 [Morchella conica CCBAS932]
MSAASIPTYFTTNADYKTWTLLAFLTAESAALETPIDTEIKRRLGDAWNSTLLHYANDAENPRRAGWAERLRREWKDVRDRLGGHTTPPTIKQHHHNNHNNHNNHQIIMNPRYDAHHSSPYQLLPPPPTNRSTTLPTMPFSYAGDLRSRCLLAIASVPSMTL